MKNVYINRINPENWNNLNLQERKKKEDEFHIVSFFLDSFNKFEGKSISVEFYEGPDFILYSENTIFNNVALEVTKCYFDKKWNSQKIDTELKLICKHVINELLNECKLPKANYFNIKFNHSVMINGRYNIEELKMELKSFIINGNRQSGNFISSVEFDYLEYCFENELIINISSDMAYIVPKINDILQINHGMCKKDLDPVLRCIFEKEKKLDIYKQDNKRNISQWWLCIEIPENAYIDPSLYKLPNGYISKFDKIFLVTEAVYGYGTHLIFKS